MAESVRLRTYVEFDTVRDKSALEKANKMVTDRQFASFVSSVVKVVLNHPELIENIENMQVVSTEYKDKHIADVIDKVLKLEDAITAINEEVLLLKEFIRLHKMLGMEQKVDNVLSAELLVKRQIRKLNTILGKAGTDLIIDSKFIQNEFDEQNKRAEDVVAFAIEYYDGIISELRETVKVREVETVREVEKAVTEEKKEEKSAGSATNRKLEDTSSNQVAKISSTDDASANLTDEDMDAMGAFFGF